MNNKYFILARNEERSGNNAAALLLYLSSFCDSCNNGFWHLTYGVVSKIRKLQLHLMLTDPELSKLIHSYGPLSDYECKELLNVSICIVGISKSNYEH